MITARYQSKSSPGYYIYATGTGTREDPLLCDFNSGMAGKNLLEIVYTGESDSRELLVAIYYKNSLLQEWYPLTDEDTGTIKEFTFPTSGIIEDIHKFRHLLSIEPIEQEVRVSIYSDNSHINGGLVVSLLPCFRPTIMPYISTNATNYTVLASLQVTVTGNDDGLCSWKIFNDPSYVSNGGTKQSLGVGYQLVQLRKIVDGTSYYSYVYVLLTAGTNFYYHSDAIVGSG